MSKKRVYELAREVGLESKVVIKKLKEIGIAVASHQSALDEKQIQKFHTSLKTPAELAAEAQKQPVVRRRKKKVVKKVEEEAPQAEEESFEAAAEKLFGGKTPSKEVEASKEESSSPSATSIIKTQGAEELETKPSGEVSPAKEEAEKKVELKSEQKEITEEKPLEKIEEKVSEPAQEKKESSFSEKLVTEVKKPDTLPETEKTASAVTKEEPSSKPQDKAQKPATMSEGKEAASVKSKQEEKKAETVSTKPAGVSPKRFQGGATIVRRATKEESEALQLRESHRYKKKEDSPRGAYNQGRSAPPRRREPGSSDESVRRFQSSSTSTPSSAPEVPRFTSDEKGSYSSGSSYGASRPDYTKKPPEPADKAKTFVKQKKSKFSFNPTMLEAEEFTPSPRKMRVFSNSSGGRRRDMRSSARQQHKKTQITVPRQEYRVVKMERDTIAVSELALQLNVKAVELIKKLMQQGVMATVNQEVDFDTVSLIAGEYNYECKSVKKTVEDVLPEVEVKPEDLETRPPIITVMGHVDHGKTSILDAIRQTGVADKEAGGITQHIGAYMVDRGSSKLTFLDTPGHEAFSAMRSRGAQLTDIVILVVAADDGVMPQTIEAIAHAKASNVPVVVAVNKIDKENVNFDRIYSELSEQGIQAESWGGDTQFVHVSALKKEGLDELLEAIQLQAEVLDLKASPKGMAKGTVVEAHLDKGRGAVATAIVTSGTLSVGDFVVVGSATGRVRAMADHEGRKLKKAGPSTPVEIIGLGSIPLAADPLNVVADDKTAREVSALRQAAENETKSPTSSAQSLDELLGQVQADSLPQISVLLKADTQGTVEAISDSISKLKSEKVTAKVIYKGVGGITESDLNLAETCNAVILGFNVRMPGALSSVSDRKGIVVKYFSVIYKLVDAVKGFMAGKLPPVTEEVIQGHAEVKEAIRIPKIGLIAGSNVTDGKITRNSHLRLIRNDVVIHTGKLAALKRFKDDVKEVQSGYECGISFENCTDIKAGDVIESYIIEESPAELDI